MATTRAMLWSAAGVMLVGAVTALVVLLSPVPEPDVRERSDGGGGATASVDGVTAEADALPPLESYEPILAQVFNEPLEAPPVQVETVRHVPLEQHRPMSVELVGTVGDSLALLQTSDGTMEVVSVGDSLDGAEVLSIDADGRVTVRFDDQEQVLERVPDEPPVGSITGS